MNNNSEKIVKRSRNTCWPVSKNQVEKAKTKIMKRCENEVETRLDVAEESSEGKE